MFNYFGVTDTQQLFEVSMYDMTHTSSKFDKKYSVNSTKTVEWTPFKQQFNNVPRYFQLKIDTSDSFGSMLSDIGIDDIEVNPYKCSTEIDIPTASPPSENILNCDFEAQCNWKFSEDKDWKIGSHQDRK